MLIVNSLCLLGYSFHIIVILLWIGERLAGRGRVFRWIGVRRVGRGQDPHLHPANHSTKGTSRAAGQKGNSRSRHLQTGADFSQEALAESRVRLMHRTLHQTNIRLRLRSLYRESQLNYDMGVLRFRRRRTLLMRTLLLCLKKDRRIIRSWVIRVLVCCLTRLLG